MINIFIVASCLVFVQYVRLFNKHTISTREEAEAEPSPAGWEEEVEAAACFAASAVEAAARDSIASVAVVVVESDSAAPLALPHWAASVEAAA